MTPKDRDEAAAEVLARAAYKAWPARIVAKAAAGSGERFAAALRADPEGRKAVIAALSDEEERAR